MPLNQLFTLLAATSGFLAVGLGAFGAHGLKDRLPADLMAVWQTAVQYHFWHTLALLGIAILLGQQPAAKPLQVSGWLFASGIVVFSGSLYLLCVTGQRWLGAITPIGGTLWLVGWACLCYGAIRGQ